MSANKTLLAATLVAVLVVLVIGLLITGKAQAQARGGFDPAQFRQRQMDRIKEAMGASDETWAKLQPGIEKVLTLSSEVNAGMRFGRRRRSDAETSEQSAIEKAAADLQATVDNKESTPDQIKAKLAALREARDKTRAELEQARADLAGMVDVRQEAVLVLQGVLE